MREWLNLLVVSSDYDDGARPGFLRNVATGESFEYDRWYVAGVAFEFNGPQHYHTTKLYPDPNQIAEIRARDDVKLGLSAQHDVVLVTVTAENLTCEWMTAAIIGTGRLPIRIPRRDDPVAEHLTRASSRYIREATGSWPDRPTVQIEPVSIVQAPGPDQDKPLRPAL